MHSPSETNKPRGVLLCIERAAALAAAIAVLGMMLIGAADVIGTAAFGVSLPGAYELTEALMVVSIFLALALSQREGRQIQVTLLAHKLPPRGRAALALVAELLSFAVYLAIAGYGLGSALESWHINELSSGLLRFSLWPSKLALGLGALLMAIQSLAGAYVTLRRAL